MAVREAALAGSWYSGNGNQLTSQLDSWLSQVDENALEDGKLPLPGARVIISPHAGYSYSGPAAAWAFKSLDISKAKRIFILHPSHHVHLRTAALPTVQAYRTPLDAEPLPLDLDTIQALAKTTMNTGYRTLKFTTMSKSVDENEHSGEMQLPYLHRLLQKQFPDRQTSSYPPLVPMMIGITDEAAERALGEVLAPYVADETNAFIISSDFCHWGTRFSYTFYLANAPSPATSATLLPNGIGKNAEMDVHTKHDWSEAKTLRSSQAPSKPKIHESIAEVDRACMCAIASGEYDQFRDIIEETGNTVCGRHPIGVFMAAVEHLEQSRANSGANTKGRFRFLRYERSSDVSNARDSSVSYVSAFAVL